MAFPPPPPTPPRHPPPPPPPPPPATPSSPPASPAARFPPAASQTNLPAHVPNVVLQPLLGIHVLQGQRGPAPQREPPQRLVDPPLARGDGAGLLGRRLEQALL